MTIKRLLGSAPSQVSTNKNFGTMAWQDQAGVNIGGGTATLAGVTVNGSTVPTNGVYLPATNAVGVATASTLRAQIGATGGVSIGSTTDLGSGTLNVTNNIYTNGATSTSVTETGILIRRNSLINNTLVTRKADVGASSTLNIDMAVSTLGIANNLYFHCEIDAGMYGNSSTGPGSYKGIVSGYIGAVGSTYQQVNDILNTITAGSFTLSVPSANVIRLAIQNTSATQAKVGVVKFNISWFA